MEECVKEYMLALNDPWTAGSPCIPDVISIPSYKYKKTCTFDFTVGTGKVGFFVASGMIFLPHDGKSIAGPPFSSTAAYNPINSVVFTTSAYAATVNDSWPVLLQDGTNNYQPGLQGLDFAQSPFSASQLNNNKIMWRLVGFGARIHPTGTVSNRAGTISLIRFDPEYYPSSDFNNNVLNARPDTHRTSITTGPYYVSYTPKHPDDVDYVKCQKLSVAGVLFNTVGNVQVGVPEATLGCYVIGATPGDTFSVDLVAHYEIIGQGYPTTPSHSSPVAMAKIIQESNSLNKMANGALDMGRMAAKVIGSNWRDVAQVAGNVYLQATRGHPRAAIRYNGQ